MTLEYLELMEDVKKAQEQVAQQEAPKPTRRKLQKSFKSNTRIYDDGSIEVDPQAQGEPSQKDVKKVGKSKRYITSGKNPLTCIELKCPEDVADKAAFFQLLFIHILQHLFKGKDLVVLMENVKSNLHGNVSRFSVGTRISAPPSKSCNNPCSPRQ